VDRELTSGAVHLSISFAIVPLTDRVAYVGPDVGPETR
jgi:hypothetical protein